MVKSYILNRNSFSNIIIGVVSKEDCSKENEDEQISLHSFGTAGMVVQMTGTNWPRPSYSLLVTGICRFKLESLAQESPYLIGVIKQLDKFPEENLGKLLSFSKLFKINEF